MVVLIVLGAALAFLFGFSIGWKGGDVNGYERCLDEISRRWSRRFDR